MIIDALSADFNKESEREKTYKVLYKITNGSEPDIEGLEKAIRRIIKKYDVNFVGFTLVNDEQGEMFYKSTILSINIYALSLNEMLIKVLILLYAKVKSGKLKER